MIIWTFCLLILPNKVNKNIGISVEYFYVELRQSGTVTKLTKDITCKLMPWSIVIILQNCTGMFYMFSSQMHFIDFSYPCFVSMVHFGWSFQHSMNSAYVETHLFLPSIPPCYPGVGFQHIQSCHNIFRDFVICGAKALFPGDSCDWRNNEYSEGRDACWPMLGKFNLHALRVAWAQNEKFTIN